MRSDIEIANAADLNPILQVAQAELGIEPGHLVPYGHYKANVDLGYLRSLDDRPLGKLILMTALSPTRRYSPSCRKRSSFDCAGRGSSPISSRKSVPPEDCRIFPRMPSLRAPVNAPDR